MTYMSTDDAIYKRKGRRKHVGKFIEDGFCKEKRLIYEYLSCLWDGCDCIKKSDNK